ncbi:MAG: RNA-binding S4 domain-containing protein [Bacillota bacterium]
MRLDKFLKVSRLIKRRTLAKEVSEVGRILVNGKVAKPATEVEAGDRIVVDYGSRTLEVEVLEVRESARVADAREMFRVLEERRVQQPDPLRDAKPGE